MIVKLLGPYHVLYVLLHFEFSVKALFYID